MQKYISAILVVALVICLNGGTGASFGALKAYATSAQQSLNDAQKNKKDAQNKLDEANKKVDALTQQSAELSAKIAAQEEELAQIILQLQMLEEEIAIVEGEIAQAEAELKEAEETAAHQYEMMKVRIVYMYERQDENAISAFIESKTISDFLNRAEYINDVYNYDRNLLDEYEATIERIETLKINLEDERHELQDVQAEYEENKAQEEKLIAGLESQLSDVKSSLSSAKAKAAEYKKTIEEQNKLIKAAQDKIAAQNATTNKGGSTSSGSSGGSATVTGGSGTGAQIAQYGLKFVGTPYVWGGNSLTSGVDCSGFVNQVYSAFGYGVPRQSGAFQSVGVGVSYDQAQPGDIVCYVGHVGIYIGGGQIVHAKNTQSGVCVDSIFYDRKGVVCIRRVVN